MRPLFGDQRRRRPAQKGRQRRHRRERGHRAGEDELLRVLHRHDRGDEEGLVADLGDEDHAPGLEEALLFFGFGWGRERELVLVEEEEVEVERWAFFFPSLSIDSRSSRSLPPLIPRVFPPWRMGTT